MTFWRGFWRYLEGLCSPPMYVSAAALMDVRRLAAKAESDAELLDARADRKRERTHATPTNRRALTSEVR